MMDTCYWALHEQGNSRILVVVGSRKFAELKEDYLRINMSKNPYLISNISSLSVVGFDFLDVVIILDGDQLI